MKLHEYQSKQIFGRFGIPVPNGKVADTPEAARQIAQELGGPVVVKAQVLVGGRGKAGGVKLAKTPDEAEQRAKEILGMQIKGLPVKKVLIDPAADIREELYLGVVLDRAARRVAVMASAAGGVDIEEVAATTPEKIITVRVDPLIGLAEYQARQLAYGIGLKEKKQVGQFIKIVKALYNVFINTDASLAEINPLAIVGDEGNLMALDGKIVLDDNALFRHPDLAEMRDESEETPAEREARLNGLSYVDLDGTIGCLVNGAGLAMATMDVIKLFGGEPANFLDIGGGARAEKVAAALRIILSDPKVRAVLVNIFGGITRGDEVARGIVQAIEEVKPNVPFVVRVVGTNAEEARKILESANMITAETLAEAAQKAVEVANQAA
ncbi:succinyl-CoA synthetase beta subunit [Ardenticatena maritima]|uniref:Succinate--CoA ligase [ADP-forming] subunit beta n=1 Tax=Ardenticatena maritima TaxID=872965 RepID=A0A0M8KBA6_9CHLR|nr:ADP-forming succinate--CoA ligase subunit beta [Ardenticatena maritima]KPL85781.1 succinyl-CoA synthetase subunit beta [Ardenticatena maritima]GAP64512.1 succinyl-CoA synthetase beta subunit [Ardenticatena maritima]